MAAVLLLGAAAGNNREQLSRQRASPLLGGIRDKQRRRPITDNVSGQSASEDRVSRRTECESPSPSEFLRTGPFLPNPGPLIEGTQ